MPSAYWLDFNDLWNYDDPAATESRFREILANSAEKSADYVGQLKTQIARTFGLRGQFYKAHAQLDEVEKEMPPDSLVEVRYLLERGRTFNSNKKPEAAMPLFLRASNLAQSLHADFYTVDALHMLGIAAPAKDQLTWNLKAIEFAQSSSDGKAKGWLPSLYNNTAWSLFDEGRYTEALELFQKAVPLREAQGKPKETRIAKWSVAKTLRVMGRLQDALEMQQKLLQQEPDEGFINEEMGECLLALNKPNEAKPYFAKAYDVLSKVDWVAEDKPRVNRLLELSK